MNPMLPHTLIQLALAFLMGLGVVAVYAWARARILASSSFPLTLLLLCVLIAMVTQVIGDNVARAFSLVGALSIVRFRTVVRDTRDTAYVILAVIAGMAVGAGNTWIASLGILSVALAEFLFRFRPAIGADISLTLRAAPGMDLDQLLTESLNQLVRSRRLESLAQVKQGESIEAHYHLHLAPGVELSSILSALTAIDGIHHVTASRRSPEET